MPIYEYRCSDCGQEFEVLHGINETPRLRCDKCQGANVTRLMSTGAFVFKGSGFYATDYKARENMANGKQSTEAPSCSACPESKGCPSAAAKD